MREGRETIRRGEELWAIGEGERCRRSWSFAGQATRRAARGLSD